MPNWFMKCFIVCLILLILLPRAYSQQGWREHEMEVKVMITNPGDARILKDLKLNGDIHTQEGFALLYLTPDESERLKTLGFSASITKNDLNEYYKVLRKTT
jgi:hypothetical protein